MNINPPSNTFDASSFFAEMRQQHPVACDTETGVWAVYRYDDARMVLTDYETFSSVDPNMQRNNPDTAGPVGPANRSIIRSDPPLHRKLRNLLSSAFTPRTIAQLEPRIAEIAQQLFDKVKGAGQMEFMSQFALPLPVTVIAEMLGVPTSDRDRFKSWADQLVLSGPPISGRQTPFSTPGGAQVWREMAGYFTQLLQERRRDPQDDLMTRLVQAEMDGERLTESDLLTFCVLLLLAGYITTTNLLGNAIVTLLAYPEQMHLLQANHTLIPSTVEEVLRYEAPLQAMSRVTAKDVRIADQEIPAGQRIIAWIASANRDETKFAHADQFDIARDPNPHIAFGFGIHYCLGAPLARLEGNVALRMILEQWQDLRRADAEPLQAGNWGTFLHGPDQLRIRFATKR